MRFPSQNIWITGASSGIGEALAVQLSREGANLILSSRRPEQLERVRLMCERPDTHRIVALDLTQSATFPGIVARLLADLGSIDVLINNGGVSQRALASEATLEVERALMEVNYFGPVALTKALLPSMLARQSGHIVVVSSVMGYVGTPGRSTYAASKHALHGWFDSLRAEVWKSKIKVTLACPGYVDTAVAANALGPRGERRDPAAVTPRRAISPERCAAAIVDGLARGREEIYVGGSEVMGIYLKRYTPWLFSQIVRRMKFSGANPETG